MMNKVPLTVLLCGLCVLPCIHGVTREYYFVSESKTWYEAQQHCREHYTDLATVTNMEEVNRLNRTGAYTGLAWIGLFDDPASWKKVMTSDPNSWRWSANGTNITSHYQNWAGSEPNRWSLEEKCTFIYYDGLWHDYLCSGRYFFVCYTDSTQKVFHLVTTQSTQDEAVAYCRAYYTDLAVIETAAENTEVASLIQSSGTYEAWIGLYREPWRWSDNTMSSFTNWGTVPGPITEYNCAAENTDHLWYPQTCDQRLPFFCHGEKKSYVVKINFSSALDMTDPKNNGIILQEIEKQLNETGHSGVKVTFKTPPKKKNNSFRRQYCIVPL